MIYGMESLSLEVAWCRGTALGYSSETTAQLALWGKPGTASLQGGHGAGRFASWKEDQGMKFVESAG